MAVCGPGARSSRAAGGCRPCGGRDGSKCHQMLCAIFAHLKQKDLKLSKFYMFWNSVQPEDA